MHREEACAPPWYGFSVENQVWNFYSFALWTGVSKINFLYVAERNRIKKNTYIILCLQK